MALVSTPFGLYYPMGPEYFPLEAAALNTVATLNAATDKIAFVGRAYIAGRPAGSKTISAAGGGSISFRIGTTTFANAGTSVTVGIQDVDLANGPAGRPDGSFDVQGPALVGGGGGIVTASWNTFTMTGGSGSKSITHGDFIAVVMDMTARVSDSVVVTGGNPTRYNLPLCSAFDAGAWATAGAQSVPACVITFDDGTLAILDGGLPFSTASSEAFSDSTNPDERGTVFQVPWDCKIDAYYLVLGFGSLTTADFTVALYSDPLGTPAVVSGSSISYLAEWGRSTSIRSLYLALPAELSLDANTDYCLAVRATGAGAVSLAIATLGDEDYRAAFIPGGSTIAKATRDGGSGAFALETPAITIYPIAVRISAAEQSSGGGAGGTGSRMLRGIGI